MPSLSWIRPEVRVAACVFARISSWAARCLATRLQTPPARFYYRGRVCVTIVDYPTDPCHLMKVV